MSLSFYFLSHIVASAYFLFLSFFVFLKNKKSESNRSFLFFGMSLFVWLFFSSFANITADQSRTLIWYKLSYTGIIFIPYTFFYFISCLIEMKNKKIFIINWTSAFCFVCFLWFSNLLMDGLHRYSWGYYPKASFILHPLFLVFFNVLFSSALILVFVRIWGRKYNLSNLQKLRLKYVFFGSLLGTFGSIDFLANYGIDVYPFGFIFMIIFPTIYGYAIVKYRLMDINIAVTRAGVFSVVYSLVLGIPFALGWWGRNYLFELLGIHWWLVPVGVSAVLATVGPFIYLRLQSHAENIILREERKYQTALHDLSRSVARIKSVEQLSDILVHEIVQSVGVSYAATYFFEEGKQQFLLKSQYQNHESAKKYNVPQFFSKDHRLIAYFENSQDPIIIEEVKSRFNHSFDFEAGMAVPFFIKNGLAAFLLVGDKARHQIFTQDDVIAFDMLSRWTSLAIENCYFWQEVQLKERQTRLQEMDTYAYSLAHEIENPIQSVYGLSDILKEEVEELLKKLGVDEEKRKDISNTLERITIDSKRVLDITEAISEFGKPSSGKLMPLRVEDVIDSFSYLMVPAFKKETVKFTREIQEKMGFIRGAKQELIQALVIFANNSLHALLGTQEKKIHLKAWQEGSDKIRISLTDNGYGIKKEILPIIFAPFVTTKASTEGKGMGLRNAQEFLKRQNGKIWAESEGQGKGATFTIELPVAKDVTEEDLKQQDEGKSVIF